MKIPPISRREFIRKSGMATAAATLGANSLSARSLRLAGSNDKPWSYNFFSKHLQFLDYKGAAEACAAAGMNGADLTVRPGGHVLPENVEKDLPLAVKAFREAGQEILMMASGITDPEDPLTERVLSTASGQGIKYYRLGYYKYDAKLSIPENLDLIKVKMEGLARLNEKYGIHGAYQNHAGSNFGAPVWDLWHVLKDMDPRWTGVQYDIRHATVEGHQSWPLGLKLLKDYIHCMVIKDFNYADREGESILKNLPVGEGVVDFPAYFQLVHELGIHGPISIHMEYPMLLEKDMSQAQMKKRAIELMRIDLDALKGFM